MASFLALGLQITSSLLTMLDLTIGLSTHPQGNSAFPSVFLFLSYVLSRFHFMNMVIVMIILLSHPYKLSLMQMLM